MAVFRFLINVDKCLDTAHYNCFFYKLKSRGNMGQGLLHISEAQLPEGAPLSLRGAVSDIRMYLDKYPYEVGDYRIILLMRSVCTKEPKVWEDTLLYRLLRLRYEFAQSRIMLSTAVGEGRDNALNLVMLYDSDFEEDQPELKPYFESPRLSEDVAILLKKYGVDPDEEDVNVLLTALKKSRLQGSGCADENRAEAYAAPFEADLLLRCCQSRIKDDEVLDGQEDRESLGRTLTVFASRQMENYRVYEQYINRSNRREETLAFLRLTDFINHDTEAEEKRDGKKSVTSLAKRCDDAWNAVWSDPSAEARFANMLARYQARLQDAGRSLDEGSPAADAKTKLPELSEPSRIEQGEHYPEDSAEQERRTTVQKELERYAKKKLFRKSFREDWNKTYENIVNVLNNLKGSLRIYAQDLSRQYADSLAKRKKETSGWKDGNYVVFEREREKLEAIEKERAGILVQLKATHMTPAMSFADVLNSERKLEQASKNISFYLDCLRETTLLNFLLLLVACAGFFVLHYTILQPYNFSELKTAIYHLCYIGVVLVLMGTMLWMPYRHYCRCVKKSIKELKEELEKYIRGYEERKKYFCEYINHINRLDYLTRRRDLLVSALERGRKLTTGMLWHRDQIVSHEAMLNFFGGLIATAAPSEQNEAASKVTVLSEGRVLDVDECTIYWPLDRGDET